jgi:hypothetical protein
MFYFSLCYVPLCCCLHRRFGPEGSGPGQIGLTAAGLRFTTDGLHVVVAERGNARLSMFTVNGEFVRHIGVGVLANGVKDVACTQGGNLVVADCGNHRVCSFAADTGALLRMWGTEGTTDGKLRFPVALCIAGSKLLLLDLYEPRLHVLG